MKKIEILGTGCPKCKKTFENVKKAVEEVGTDAEIVKIEDINEITERGVFMTPAVVIEGDTIKEGGIARKEEIKTALQKLKE